MNPAELPPGRDHLDEDERADLLRFELLIAQGRHDEAQDVIEQLWATATDAHRGLFQALSNAITAVCARERGQLRGAYQIARQSRAMLEPFPRLTIGVELDVLMGSVDRFIDRGGGQILLLRQG